MPKTGGLIVLSGPSGVGKRTVCERILKINSNLKLAISATTREPGNEDAEAVTYYFKDKKTFEAMIQNDEFIEWTKYNQNYYGTLKSEVTDKLNSGQNLLLEIEPCGAMNVKRQFPNALLIFIEPPSLEALIERLTKRGRETQDEIHNRVETAKEEMAARDNYDYVVMNDNLDEAVYNVSKIVNNFIMTEN